LPTGEKWTPLTLQDVGPALKPSRVLLESAPDAAAAISLDGIIVVSKPAAKGQGLYVVEPNGSPVDTGIRVTTGSAIRFGPHGDLFVQEPNANFSAMSFSEYRPAATRAWQKVTGPCKFVVTPERVGCPDATGPAIVLDPPVPFDHVTAVLPLVAVGERFARTGGPIERSWNVRPDVPLGTSCDSDECWSMFIPGPGSTAWAAVLEGDRVDVLGALGNELICVQTAGGVTRLVAYDLP
jgi:hypothetical protein